MERISTNQLFILTVFFQIGTTIIFGFGSSAGRDAWIAIITSFVLGIIAIGIYLLLRYLNPGLTLVEWFPAQFGKWIFNAHGRDIRYGTMAGTVRKMTIITPTGELKTVTQNDNEEWMKYVFGGYGLFGIILDVTLELTENDVYTIHTEELKTNEYEAYFSNLLRNENTSMHYARVSVAPCKIC
ncbi:hypothetical protein QFZ31_000227 [Neobacillus niacini]|uniref:GerAB/ArcD/ProY family transporter n=1 Tax=Neobacillus driksii TaxID=3035913 RepID=UPI00278862F6|nr:GerAB/ArcD/ProY family transporter [Neobacillus niacini]MDQ0970349.1 hypothetical protein [Neobacillus niacini]